MSTSTSSTSASAAHAARLSYAEKAALLVRIWVLALRIRIALSRRPLPEVVAALDSPAAAPRLPAARWLPAARLARAVNRGLRVGRWRPRCLLRSLVLYRLLRAQGNTPELIIGLPRVATTDAHSWIELDGVDVGPWPGRFGHEELARYPVRVAEDRSSA